MWGRLVWSRFDNKTARSAEVPEFPDLGVTHPLVRGLYLREGATMRKSGTRHVAVGVAVPMPGHTDGGDRR